MPRARFSTTRSMRSVMSRLARPLTATTALDDAVGESVARVGDHDVEVVAEFAWLRAAACVDELRSGRCAGEIVAFEQTHRQPARRRGVRPGGGFEARGEVGDRAFQVCVIGNVGARRLPHAYRLADRRLQRVDAVGLREATTGTTGQPRRRDRAAASIFMPLRSATSIMLSTTSSGTPISDRVGW